MEKDIIGKEVKDVVTGVRGIAIGVTNWVSGCTTIGVQPRKLKAGKDDRDGSVAEVVWFDENRIDVVGEGVTKRFRRRTTTPLLGGPQPTPRDGRQPARCDEAGTRR